MNNLHQNIQGENVQPQTDTNNEPIQDGAIPQDTSGVSSGEYDSLSTIGQEQLVFTSGNWNTFKNIISSIEDKYNIIVSQVVPLIEVALIELLGQSSSYKRQEGNINILNESNKISLSFLVTYAIPQWIGIDIEVKSIAADATYILNKIKLLQNITINKCAINTSEGLLTVSGLV